MTLRKIAALVVAMGLSLGLIGAGLSASFTDGGTATQNIHVNTLACAISAPAGAGVVVATDGSWVTYTAPDINGSGPGSAPFDFSVIAGGEIPLVAHLTATTPAAPFTDLLGPVADVPLAPGEAHLYHAGLEWPELGNAAMGTDVSITYTVSCVEPPVGPQIPLNTRTWVGETVTVYVHQFAASATSHATLQPGATMRFIVNSAWWPSTGVLATADADGNLYWQGTVPPGVEDIQIVFRDASDVYVGQWYPYRWTASSEP